MEQETLFTSSKWDILKCLEKGKKSPYDLAKESKTSIANISQQLRLLELAGFVKSERISNRDKGLPRILYSLTDNHSYFIVSSPNFVNKKFIKLQEYQKAIIKIWFIENTSLHYYIEKFFWSIEKHFDKLDLVALDLTDAKTLKVVLISENPEVKKSIKDTIIDGTYGPKQFIINFTKEAEFKKNISKYHILHDPKLIGYTDKKIE